ncbi:MAG TPA: BadF/BadG/BcrA/BcrD ATPase family protein [Thiolinea sp.]|nr:BadF/BadG/BcrA/BcrD ATPase family protein [Thiolinea sp.]
MQGQDSTPLFIGIDGGGSHCRARLADRHGRILGQGCAGPANFRLGVGQVRATILECSRQALEQAGLHTTELKQLQAGIGLAGAVLEEDLALATPITTLFARCELRTDAYIACLGAHRGQAGGILILGTGSCAQIICAREVRTFGGWGFTLGDQGSGAWLGHQAVRLALLALEGIVPDSPLTRAVSADMGAEPTKFLAWSMNARPADFARFAPRVFEHAGEDDPHALALLAQASADVCRLLEVLARYRTGRIALLGGLSGAMSRWLPETIRTTLVPAQGDALDGALLLARQGLSQE